MLRLALFAPSLLFTCCLMATPICADTVIPLYRDPERPIAERVEDLLSRMTLEEKVSQMTFRSPAVERLGVPGAYWWNQCLSGVVGVRPTTQFPSCIAMAATWDPELVNELATAISDEARALYNIGAQNRRGVHGLFYRAPVVNISRDPRWGRIHEVWGEDPLLTSQLGVAYVRGLQGDHPKYLKLVSTLKHFACNNEERRRLSGSSEVPERVLREYWLPHFKACVQDGGAMSIMAAYNAINGVPCNINHRLLTEILRDEWGFEGFVVSDTGAIRRLVTEHHAFESFEEAAAAAVKAGVDLDSDQFHPVLVESVRRGLIDEQAIDAAVTRLLTAKFRLGVFDPPEMVPYTKIPERVICSEKHRQLARRANAAAMVLLKNSPRLLPLDLSELRSVAIIGPHADQCYLGPGYVGIARQTVTPLQGLTRALGPAVAVRYARGCDIVDEGLGDKDIQEAAEAARASDVAILLVGTDRRVEREGIDRESLGLPGRQPQLVKAVVEANPRTVVVLVNGGPLSIPWTAERAPAIVEAFFSGEQFGGALADVLLGRVNPAARLPYTVYQSVDDLPPPDDYEVSHGYTYMYLRRAPLFPFGHGLSYTRFTYSDLQIEPMRVSRDGPVNIRVTVRNTGERAGDEVAQLYVRVLDSRVSRPNRQLAAFRRIHLEPGQSQTIRWSVPTNRLAYYDMQKRAFVIEAGELEWMVGRSSEDIRLTGRSRIVAP